jgi:hypothetical protein
LLVLEAVGVPLGYPRAFVGYSPRAVARFLDEIEAEVGAARAARQTHDGELQRRLDSALARQREAERAAQQARADHRAVLAAIEELEARPRRFVAEAAAALEGSEAHVRAELEGRRLALDERLRLLDSTQAEFLAWLQRVAALRAALPAVMPHVPQQGAEPAPVHADAPERHAAPEARQDHAG